MALKEGDIVLVRLGEVGKSIKGHEQAKTRPCLVIKAVNALDMVSLFPLLRPGLNTHPYNMQGCPVEAAG